VQRCDPFQRFWPACLFWLDRQRGPIAGCSSLQTSRTAMGSTSALPRAKGVAPMPPSPTVSRGISRRRLRTAGSIRTKSPARSRRRARIAAIRAAANTSPLPANAKHLTVRFQAVSTALFQSPTFVVLPRHLTNVTSQGMLASSGFQCVFGFAFPVRNPQARPKWMREPPHYCRGNDVTLPREAGKGRQIITCGCGRSLRHGPRPGSELP
jgi:hypothetical protein